jgi:hypothetical protein
MNSINSIHSVTFKFISKWATILVAVYLAVVYFWIRRNVRDDDLLVARVFRADEAEAAGWHFDAVQPALVLAHAQLVLLRGALAGHQRHVLHVQRHSLRADQVDGAVQTAQQQVLVGAPHDLLAFDFRSLKRQQK